MKRTSILASSAILLGLFFISGNVYAADSTQMANPSTVQTPVTADLTTPQQTTPKPPSDPDDPNDTGNRSNEVTGENKNLGIAYYPKSFTFHGKLGSERLELHDSGSNTITNKATYNVGVKDNTRQYNSWKLTAKLTWDKNELPGSTITVMNPNNGEVKKNINDGVNQFKDTDLVEQNDVKGIGSGTVVINDAETPIMVKQSTTVGKGTYDYSLGNVESLVLTIPHATDLVAKAYSGNVNWNLQMTPDTATTPQG
ncbi:WxL domain-containing protein [Enterococcus casseliflavus]|uniref:WxL domain-containing protein n=1 Tax=Enterococcus casseliflavus TaxID=37734 RepID=UPI002DB963E1|nr:WxL domain-containing protein [Enterococcus casseliflavus]MEB8416391.1 WxL domain-containing protein [Enterococcus casseliflavus]